MYLHNRKSRLELKKELRQEDFERITLSFYRYVGIEDPQLFRDRLYKDWDDLNIKGRIYVATEGINAQMTVPEHHLDDLKAQLNRYKVLKNMELNYAIEDDRKSFYKLAVKVRDKIVADPLDEDEFDPSQVGRHLSPLKFHEYVDDPQAIPVDMRNFYEVEVGRFKNAFYTDANTFREALPKVRDQLSEEKDKKLLLYCTGGIRCEKASAYLRENGFEDVNQLYGGIINYVREIKLNGYSSKFIGKNFTFDARLGEKVTRETLGQCHQCGRPCDRHVNCVNEGCHLLFIQCKDCAREYEGCCSPRCQKISKLPEDERKRIFREKEFTPGRNVYNRLKNPFLNRLLQQKV